MVAPVTGRSPLYHYATLVRVAWSESAQRGYAMESVAYGALRDPRERRALIRVTREARRRALGFGVIVVGPAPFADSALLETLSRLLGDAGDAPALDEWRHAVAEMLAHRWPGRPAMSRPIQFFEDYPGGSSPGINSAAQAALCEAAALVLDAAESAYYGRPTGRLLAAATAQIAASTGVGQGRAESSSMARSI